MTKSIKNWDARKTNRVAEWIIRKVPHSGIIKEFGISMKQVRAVEKIINSEPAIIQASSVPISNKKKVMVWDTWNGEKKIDFITDAGNSMTHTDLADKFDISTTTVREYKAKFGVYVKSRGRVYAPSEIRQISKPKAEPSPQRKERNCLACGDKFTSEHFGHRTCGCNAYKSISDQMLFA